VTNDQDTYAANAEYEALLQFMYLAPIGLVQAGNDGEIQMINPMSAQLLMPLSVDGRLANLFVALESVAPELRSMAAAFDQPHGTICQDHRILISTGARGSKDPRVLAVSLIRLDADRLMGIIADVSETVKRERLLRESEAWFQTILSNVADYAMTSLDEAGRFEAWNTSIGRVTGLAAGEFVGQSLAILFPTDSMPAEVVVDALREADENGWSLRDGWILKAGGDKLWGSALIAPLHRIVGGGTGADTVLSAAAAQLGELLPGAPPRYALIVRDITDKREAVEKLRRANDSDHLTGLANRRALFEAGEREIARWHRSPRPLSVILVDADHFKRVNDTHGHAGGDAVLRALAQILAAAVREIDIVARIGGEEFALLLPSTDGEGALVIANRLRERVAASGVLFESSEIRFTISAGVASMAESVAGVEDLLKNADRALYRAKARGRNRVVAHDLAATT
jgi:diguanylate cyclase (GGDEF)-like protein/PAS domain S-box-containing protein